MRETIEVRVIEDVADELFAQGEGRRLGLVRVIELSPGDPRVGPIGRLQKRLIGEGRLFYSFATFKRRYSPEELRSAELLVLLVDQSEVASEDQSFDASGECPLCGSGRRQVRDLVLGDGNLPPSADLCETLGGELLVSSRAVEVITGSQTGFRIRELTSQAEVIKGSTTHKTSKSLTSTPTKPNRPSKWHQLEVTSQLVDITPQTRFGVDPFDPDESREYACPLGHTRGLNILSEAWVHRESWTGEDFVESNQLFGIGMGAIRPRRIRFLSQRAWRALIDKGLRGFRVEVAHLT